MKKRMLTTLMTVMVLLVTQQAFAAVWYVDGNAGPGGDGTSWATAFTTVQAGIDAAGATDEIWVKAGTYLLSATLNVDEQVSLYGGFAGTETAREERNWAANVTTVDGNDAVRCLWVTADNVTLDGFVITRGYTDGSVVVNGAGMQNGSFDASLVSNTTVANCTFVANKSGYHAGAIFNDLGGLTVRNCVFQENTAMNRGGAVLSYATGYATVIADCRFLQNTGKSGGAVYFTGDTGPNSIADTAFVENHAFVTGSTSCDGAAIVCDSDTTITGCTFQGNTAVRYGTVATYGDAGKTITILNSVFSGNSVQYGGGVCINGSSGDLGSVIVLNCTFSGNAASMSGGGIYNRGKTLGVDSLFTITNSVLWGDTVNEIAVGTGGAPTVSYSDVDQDGYEGVNGNIRLAPLFVGGGDFHLAAGSPCVNAGTDAGVYSDLDGDTRPLLGGFDMGSDEYSGDCWDLDSDTYADVQCGGDDCDDGELAVNPGALEGPFGDPTCSDGLDNDCDGTADAADLSCAFCTDPGQCDDGVACTEDTCDEGTQSCVNTPQDSFCDDANECTDDTCDAVEDCQHACNATDYRDACCDDPACADEPVCNGPAWGPGSVVGTPSLRSNALNYLVVLLVPCAAVLVWKAARRRR
ncbi:MAG: putative metal-binding motif-containing protein [bacterium]